MASFERNRGPTLGGSGDPRVRPESGGNRQDPGHSKEYSGLLSLIIRRSVVRVHLAPLWGSLCSADPGPRDGLQPIVGQAAIESRRLLAPGSGW
jgi:hypothetical protein